MTSLDLRPAQLADADALATFARLSFVETFVDGLGVAYPARDLDDFLATSCSTAALEALISDPDTRVWLSRSGAEVNAYAVVGPTPCRTRSRRRGSAN